MIRLRKLAATTLLLLFFSYSSSYEKIDIKTHYATFWKWKSSCDQLPTYKDSTKNPFTYDNTALTLQEFDNTLDSFLASTKKLMNNQNIWLHKDHPSNDFFEDLNQNTHLTFVQKQILPPNSKVVFIADLHGDIHSIIEILKWFADNNYLDKNDPF